MPNPALNGAAQLDSVDISDLIGQTHTTRLNALSARRGLIRLRLSSYVLFT